MSGHKLRILVIGELAEGVERYRQLLHQGLHSSYPVIEALHGIDCLPDNGEFELDGIILDVPPLPLGDLGTVTQVRSQLGDACPPILVIGDADTRLALQAGRAGAADYLVRDQVTAETLSESLRTAIENATLKQELKQQEIQFQTSVENLLDCFGIFTAIRDDAGQITDFRIEYLNQAACVINQMPRDAQVGCGLCEVLPAHRESGLFDEYCRLVETGEPLLKESLVYEDEFNGRRLSRAFDLRANKLNDGFVASWRDITQRKQLEFELNETVASLRQQQSYLQQLLNTAPIGIGIGTANGAVRLVNDAMLALHGVTREDFERDGMNWRDFCPPEYVDRIEPAMAYLRQHGFLPPEEKALLRPDGTQVPVWISATRSHDNPDEHVAFAIDLSPQKQAEAAVKASQQRYQELAEAMPQMVWRADPTGAVNYWNSRWYDYTGLTEAASFDLAAGEALHPADRDRTLTQWQQAITGGEGFEIEHRIRRHDGVYRWFINRGIPTHDATGNITGWIGTITDIEQQKRLEERLQLVLRAVDSLIYDWNAETNEMYRSEHLVELLGWHPDEVPATAEWWFEQMHPDDQARLLTPAQALSIKGSQRSKPELKESAYRLRHKAGHWVHVWDRSCLVHDDQGQLIRVVGSTMDVSPLKQTEVALHQNQERLNLAMQAAGIGMWDLNLLTQEVYWSDNLQQMFGMEPGSFNGQLDTVMAMVHPNDQPFVQTRIRQAIEEGAEYNIEFRFIKPDGTVRWALGLGRVFYDDSGRPVAMTGVDMDISDRKQAEQELREAHIQLESALAAGSIYTWSWRIPENQVFTSRSFAHLFGVEPDEATLGLPLETFLAAIHPDDQSHVSAAIKQAIQTGEPYAEEFRVSSGGVHERWVIARGQVEYDEHDNPVAFHGALADISDRKQAERELQESEERFRTLADNISQFAWMADPTGWIFWYNQRWFDYTGTTLEEMQGWGWRQVHHPDHVNRVVKHLRHCFNTGTVWEDTFPLRGQDGQYRWFLSRAVPVHNAQGEVVRWFGTNTDITDLQETELALQQATNRLDVALKSAPITLFTQDHELRYTWVYNPSWPYVADEFVGQRDEDLLSQDSGHHLAQLKQQVLDTGVGLREEVQVTVGAETRYYDLTIDPIRNSTHQVVGLTGAAVDISDRTRLEAERQQAQAELAANEARLQGFVASNVVGILYGDIDGGVTGANDEFLRIVGYSRDDLQAGRIRWDDITPPEYTSLDAEHVAEARERGACTPYEKEYIRKDGRRVPVLLAYSLVGEEQRETVAFILDVSDRKQAQRQLQASEGLLQLGMQVAGFGLAQINYATNQVTLSPEAAVLYGLPPEQPVISREQFYDTFHPDDRAQLERSIQALMDPAGAGWFAQDHRVLTPAGEVKWLSVRKQVFFDQSSTPPQPSHAVLVAIDITDRKQAEIERAQLLEREQAAREAAENANRIKDEFLAILSHELRSPLNPILGWASLLRTKTMSAEVTARALETIERNAKLQTQLIDDLLDVARILRGKLKLEMTTVDLAFVIEAAIETVQSAAEAKNITIQTDFPAIGQVRGDEGRLQQVVWNLLTNAVKFTPEGGQVEIRLMQVERWAHIQVTDTGMGIDADFLPHIFESFRQEDTSVTRQYGGLGLGLAIVRYLIEAHGGTITATSPGEKQGATFTVKLPLLSPTPTSSRSPAAITSDDIDLTGLRICVVDDNPDTLDLLTVSLENLGAEVATFDRAAAALDNLITISPNILICDIGMPEMDGYTLIRHVRSLDSDLAHIPVIALTAYVRDEERRKALSQGFQRHLAKPFDLDQLAQVIAELRP
ncbi:PAS domain-containing protein [Leptolyngbya iicbica]|nr:PAS domain-containing protein [Leptolyngbya sp. LK]